MIQAVKTRQPELGVAPACSALNVPRATFYRWGQPKKPVSARPKPTRAISDGERQDVLDVLHDDRFVDKAPAEVYATLLDEGRYLCSIRTMYRILDAANEVRERRNQLRHPNHAKPELVATGPNQVWSWDITKLRGPVKWKYFYLYVILDIFSRYVVGWMVAEKESAALAKRLIGETCNNQGIAANELTIHSDRGPSMTAKVTAQLLADLGITKSHSRPHVSNDNPYSESQFKTLKYCPSFPESFGSLEDARSFLGPFFTWYNTEHRHSGIGMMTPASVHFGFAEQIWQERRRVLKESFRRHPERFVHGLPKPPPLPTAAWINEPKTAEEADKSDKSPDYTVINDTSEVVFASQPDHGTNKGNLRHVRCASMNGKTRGVCNVVTT